MSFWNRKKVLVAGGSGFVGSHLVELLIGKQAQVTVADILSKEKARKLKDVIKKIRYCETDLYNLSECVRITKAQDIVFNLAARLGGIHYNRLHPAAMFRDNALLCLNMLEAARINNVERFQVVSSACVYPRHCMIPTPETEGFAGEPEPTNTGYGWAKRMSEIGGQLYEKEFGMKISIVRPYNAYGPRDTFDEKTSHVIPALIKRVFEGENPLVVWGSGGQSRAFFYVTDFARGLIEALEKYPQADPINLGTDEEIKIKGLAMLIVKLSGKNLKIVFDATKPDGQPRRNCSIKKAKEKIDFVARVKLKEGIEKTIEWYKREFKKS